MEDMTRAADSANTAGGPQGTQAAPGSTETSQAAPALSDAPAAPSDSASIIDQAIEEAQAERMVNVIANAMGVVVRGEEQQETQPTLGDGLDPGPEQPVVPDFDVDNPRVIEPVDILINGTRRRLRLPLRSIRAFEKLTGISIWDSEKVWTYPPNVDMLQNVLWAALIWEWPDVKISDMDDWDVFEFGNIHYVRRKLNQCWGENQPQPDEAAARGGTPPNGHARPVRPSAALSGG